MIRDIVRYQGKLYRYDEGTQLVTEYTPRAIKLSECPERVLRALFRLQRARIADLDAAAENEGVD